MSLCHCFQLIINEDDRCLGDAITNQQRDGAVGGMGADQWKSCVVCLEEMVDSELLAHTACGGTLCRACLEVRPHLQ